MKLIKYFWREPSRMDERHPYDKISRNQEMIEVDGIELPGGDILVSKNDVERYHDHIRLNVLKRILDGLRCGPEHMKEVITNEINNLQDVL